MSWPIFPQKPCSPPPPNTHPSLTSKKSQRPGKPRPWLTPGLSVHPQEGKSPALVPSLRFWTPQSSRDPHTKQSYARPPCYGEKEELCGLRETDLTVGRTGQVGPSPFQVAGVPGVGPHLGPFTLLLPAAWNVDVGARMEQPFWAMR